VKEQSWQRWAEQKAGGIQWEQEPHEGSRGREKEDEKNMTCDEEKKPVTSISWEAW